MEDKARTVLRSLSRRQQIKLFEAGDQITAALRTVQPTANGTPSRELLREGYRLLRQSFDPVWGGFGRAPKFSTPHNLLFLMRITEAEKEPEALQVAERTLQAISAGGIFNHIGGGFSRYSTDEKWLVPHFEKMLYDNALLILAYLEAFQLTQTRQYADTARRTALNSVKGTILRLTAILKAKASPTALENLIRAGNRTARGCCVCWNTEDQGHGSAYRTLSSVG